MQSGNKVTLLIERKQYHAEESLSLMQLLQWKRKHSLEVTIKCSGAEMPPGQLPEHLITEVVSCATGTRKRGRRRAAKASKPPNVEGAGIPSGSIFGIIPLVHVTHPKARVTWGEELSPQDGSCLIVCRGKLSIPGEHSHTVAIKRCRNVGETALLRREASVLKSLYDGSKHQTGHRWITDFYGWFQTSLAPGYCFAMQKLPVSLWNAFNQDGAEWLKMRWHNNNYLPTEVWAREAALAIQWLGTVDIGNGTNGKRAYIVHGDVKPHNFLVDRDADVPRLKLCDWGSVVSTHMPMSDLGCAGGPTVGWVGPLHLEWWACARYPDKDLDPLNRKAPLPFPHRCFDYFSLGMTILWLKIRSAWHTSHGKDPGNVGKNVREDHPFQKLLGSRYKMELNADRRNHETLMDVAQEMDHALGGNFGRFMKTAFGEQGQIPLGKDWRLFVNQLIHSDRSTSKMPTIPTIRNVYSESSVALRDDVIGREKDLWDAELKLMGKLCTFNTLNFSMGHPAVPGPARPYLILYGDPGIGKSTIAHTLACRLFTEERIHYTFCQDMSGPTGSVTNAIAKLLDRVTLVINRTTCRALDEFVTTASPQCSPRVDKGSTVTSMSVSLPKPLGEVEDRMRNLCRSHKRNNQGLLILDNVDHSDTLNRILEILPREITPNRNDWLVIITTTCQPPSHVSDCVQEVRGVSDADARQIVKVASESNDDVSERQWKELLRLNGNPYLLKHAGKLLKGNMDPTSVIHDLKGNMDYIMKSYLRQLHQMSHGAAALALEVCGFLNRDRIHRSLLVSIIAKIMQQDTSGEGLPPSREAVKLRAEEAVKLLIRKDILVQDSSSFAEPVLRMRLHGSKTLIFEDDTRRNERLKIVFEVASNAMPMVGHVFRMPILSTLQVCAAECVDHCIEHYVRGGSVALVQLQDSVLVLSLARLLWTRCVQGSEGDVGWISNTLFQYVEHERQPNVYAAALIALTHAFKTLDNSMLSQLMQAAEPLVSEPKGMLARAFVCVAMSAEARTDSERVPLLFGAINALQAVLEKKKPHGSHLWKCKQVYRSGNKLGEGAHDTCGDCTRALGALSKPEEHDTVCALLLHAELIHLVFHRSSYPIKCCADVFPNQAPELALARGLFVLQHFAPTCPERRDLMESLTGLLVDYDNVVAAKLLREHVLWLRSELASVEEYKAVPPLELFVADYERCPTSTEMLLRLEAALLHRICAAEVKLWNLRGYVVDRPGLPYQELNPLTERMAVVFQEAARTFFDPDFEQRLGPLCMVQLLMDVTGVLVDFAKALESGSDAEGTLRTEMCGLDAQAVFSQARVMLDKADEMRKHTFDRLLASGIPEPVDSARMLSARCSSWVLDSNVVCHGAAAFELCEQLSEALKTKSLRINTLWKTLLEVAFYVRKASNLKYMDRACDMIRCAEVSLRAQRDQQHGRRAMEDQHRIMCYTVKLERILKSPRSEQAGKLNGLKALYGKLHKRIYKVSLKHYELVRRLTRQVCREIIELAGVETKWLDVVADIKKVKDCGHLHQLCVRFAWGDCGDNGCTLAHGKQELRKKHSDRCVVCAFDGITSRWREPTGASLDSSASKSLHKEDAFLPVGATLDRPVASSQATPSKWWCWCKTKLCNAFQAGMQCPDEELNGTCLHAHGAHELRDLRSECTLGSQCKERDCGHRQIWCVDHARGNCGPQSDCEFAHNGLRVRGGPCDYCGAGSRATSDNGDDTWLGSPALYTPKPSVPSQGKVSDCRCRTQWCDYYDGTPFSCHNKEKCTYAHDTLRKRGEPCNLRHCQGTERPATERPASTLGDFLTLPLNQNGTPRPVSPARSPTTREPRAGSAFPTLACASPKQHPGRAPLMPLLSPGREAYNCVARKDVGPEQRGTVFPMQHRDHASKPVASNCDHRTVHCDYYDPQDSSSCYHGDGCQFAHEESDLRRVGDPCPLCGPGHFSGAQGSECNHRTVLCKDYDPDDPSACSRGDGCGYAHGQRYLRQIGDPCDFCRGERPIARSGSPMGRGHDQRRSNSLGGRTRGDDSGDGGRGGWSRSTSGPGRSDTSGFGRRRSGSQRGCWAVSPRGSKSRSLDPKTHQHSRAGATHRARRVRACSHRTVACEHHKRRLCDYGDGCKKAHYKPKRARPTDPCGLCSPVSECSHRFESTRCWRRDCKGGPVCSGYHAYPHQQNDLRMSGDPCSFCERQQREQRGRGW